MLVAYRTTDADGQQTLAEIDLGDVDPLNGADDVHTLTARVREATGLQDLTVLHVSAHPTVTVDTPRP